MSELHRNDTTVSSIDSRTCWPLPVRSRASRAAVMAWAAWMPVNLSGRMVRTSRGLSSSEPACTVARPDTACTIGIEHRLVHIRPVESEPGDGDVDDLGVELAHRGLSHADPLGHAGSEVLHDDVGGAGDAPERGQSIRMLEIQHDGALVAVVVQERRREAAPARRRLPGVISPRRFDLDHVRTLIGQRLRGERAGDHGRQNRPP